MGLLLKVIKLGVAVLFPDTEEPTVTSDVLNPIFPLEAIRILSAYEPPLVFVAKAYPPVEPAP